MTFLTPDEARAEGAGGRRPWRAGTLAAIVVAAWFCVLFDGALFRGETFIARDLTPFHRPLLAIVPTLWHGSEGLPLWNPYLANGQPFAANPNCNPLHPLTLLALFMPAGTALAIGVLLPLAVAFAAMLLLLRTLGRSRWASLWGGCSWALGGYALSLTNLLASLRTVAFIPLVAALAVRTRRDPRPGNIGLLALATGMCAAGGEPGALLGCAVLVITAWVADRRPPRTAGRRRGAGHAWAGLALGLAIAAAVLVPAARLAARSVRSEPLGAVEAQTWSFAPPRLLEPVLPHVMGHIAPPDDDAYWGRTWYGDKTYPYILSVYAGLLVPLLALLAVAHRPRAAAPWLATAGAGALLALGSHLPLWGPLRDAAPLLARLRYPERWVLLPALAAVILASAGFDRVLEPSSGARRRVRSILAGLAVMATIAAAAVALTTALGTPSSWTAMGIPASSAPRFAAAFPRDAMATAGFALAYMLALSFTMRHGRAATAVALLAVTAADLGLATRPLVPTARPERADAAAALLAPLTGQHPPRVLFHLAEWQRQCSLVSGLAWPLQPIEWGIPLALNRDFDLTELRWSHHATDEVLALARRRPDLLVPLLRRRGVGAVLRCTLPPGPPNPEALSRAPVELVEVRDARPLLSCVGAAVVTAGEGGWAAAVERIGATAAATAVVIAPDETAIPATPSTCRVLLARRRPDHILAEVAAAGPAPSLLAIDQTWDVGWRATIDGSPARLLRADIDLSALLVPPGAHRIELIYRDPSVTISLFVSAVALAVALVLLVLSRRRYTRTAPTTGEAEGGPSS